MLVSLSKDRVEHVAAVVAATRKFGAFFQRPHLKHWSIQNHSAICPTERSHFTCHVLWPAEIASNGNTNIVINKDNARLLTRRLSNRKRSHMRTSRGLFWVLYHQRKLPPAHVVNAEYLHCAWRSKMGLESEQIGRWTFGHSDLQISTQWLLSFETVHWGFPTFSDPSCSFNVFTFHDSCTSRHWKAWQRFAENSVSGSRETVSSGPRVSQGSFSAWLCLSPPVPRSPGNNGGLEPSHWGHCVKVVGSSNQKFPSTFR